MTLSENFGKLLLKISHSPPCHCFLKLQNISKNSIIVTFDVQRGNLLYFYHFIQDRLFQTLRGLLTLFSCLGKGSKSRSIEGLQKMAPRINIAKGTTDPRPREGWVHLSKETYWVISQVQTSSESRPSNYFKISNKSFSNPENCYDIIRQLASFTAIKFTKQEWVS